MKKYITQDRLKKNNIADIFTLIMEEGKVKRREIESKTGFSWGTVSTTVAYLIEQGYLREVKDDNGAVGRASSFLELDGSNYVSIGLDINRTGLKAEIVGLDLSVKERIYEPFNANTQDEVLAQAFGLCERAIALAKTKHKVFSLGIAFQGAVNGKEGISLRFPSIKDWQPINVKKLFIDKFNLPVYLAHDPKCALISALCQRKLNDLVLIRIDNGIGMAVLSDGKILDDTEKLELGHTIVGFEDGAPVTLESVATMRGIESRVNADFEIAVQEEEKAVTDGIDKLSVALYNVAMLFRPQKIIITGRAVINEKFDRLIKEHPLTQNLDIEFDGMISASLGAAAEGIKSAIRSLEI